MKKTALSLEDAKKIAAAAEAEAMCNGWPVVICVVDDGGHLLYLQRGPETQWGSVDVAIAKARSAAAFRRPTKAWEERLAEGRLGYLNLPGAMTIEGGLPISVEGQVAGGIGVSGVRSHQDAQIAQAGVDALAKKAAR
ncbi:MAG: heme-binding protein [Betaproteobacteria bacterium]|nr:heme-binding protein [Betaproteobacteria bacterium]